MLFDKTKRVGDAVILIGDDRKAAAATIIAGHYTRSVPSGKSHYVRFGDALVIWSIPANKNIAAYLLGKGIGGGGALYGNCRDCGHRTGTPRTYSRKRSPRQSALFGFWNRPICWSAMPTRMPATLAASIGPHPGSTMGSLKNPAPIVRLMVRRLRGVHFIQAIAA